MPAVVVAMALLLAAPVVARAETFNVHPGNNAIQKAVNKAGNGDRIRVHDGTYREDVDVDKRLRITDAGDGRPTIDGRCTTDRVIDVIHGGVALRGLRVKGARDEYTINMIGVPSGAVKDVVMRETCGADDAALYGINTYESGHLNLRGNDAKGFEDAGIYVGEISDTEGGPLRVRANNTHGNNVGVLIEDVFDVPEVDVRVRNNRTNGNTLDSGLSAPAGILIRRSDGVLVADNVANSNGDYGIHVDDQSDDNVINNNDASSNGTSDFFDEGTNNCGAGNSFAITPCM
jgi:parallel beta-helix repeat protein